MSSSQGSADSQGKIVWLSGNEAATVATDDWPVVFKSLLLECAPPSAVVLLANGEPIGPIGAQAFGIRRPGRFDRVDLTQPLQALHVESWEPWMSFFFID